VNFFSRLRFDRSMVISLWHRFFGPPYRWKGLNKFRISVSNCALTLLVGRQEGHPVRKKTERWGDSMVICLERGADLHTAQWMPLPLTVSCFSKIQIGFTFLVPAHPGSPGQRAVKRVCVCVCVCVLATATQGSSKSKKLLTVSDSIHVASLK